MKKVWFCMVSGRESPPKAQHKTLEAAIKEAKRLHEMFKSKVRVLEVVECFEAPIEASVEKEKAKVKKEKSTPVITIKKKRLVVLPEVC